MELFDFPYHQVTTRYPDRQNQVQLGGGWTYTIKPATPPAREFQVAFPALRYFFNALDVMDLDTQPYVNAGRLEAFYRAHEMHESFFYNHPHLGNLVVKFKAPLEVPPVQPQSNGVVKSVTVTLIEQPV